MICAICRSSDFEEDNQGFLFCVACGTQNEEIFAVLLCSTLLFCCALCSVVLLIACVLCCQESFENEGASQSAFGAKNIIKNYVKVLLICSALLPA